MRTLLVVIMLHLGFAVISQSVSFKSTPDSIIVSSFSTIWKNAWAGGINAAQFNSLDVNQDGINDIVVFDRAGNTVSVFLVTGSGSNVQHKYTDVYDAKFPPVRDWMLLYDYNGDGHPDIFTYQPGGIRIYKNTTAATGDLSFQLIRPSNTPQGAPLHSLYTNSYVNLFVSSVNIPALYDVDGDGDMDILTFGSWGTTLHYHRNMSMEKYGHSDSLDFELRNQCWGYFSEGFSSNALTLFDTCQWNIPNPEFHPDDVPVSGGNRHEGATLCPLDAYGNGLTDLIIGDVEYKSLTLLKNGGTPAFASAVEQDNAFPSYNVPVNLPEFPGAYYVDVDNDGIKDLLVSPNQTLSAQNFQSVWWYKNTGQNNQPVFQFQQNNFLQNDMIEVGESAIPVFVDLNQNGKKDLLIANFKYYDETNPLKQQFMLLINVGSETAPEFKLVDDNFLNISQYNLGNGLAPTFKDLNNDGKPDMIIGDIQGRLHYFTNTSSGNTISFAMTSSPMVNHQGNVIDVGDFAAPFLVDLNRDGRQDLVVGCRHGNVYYYRNSGSVTNPVFTMVTDSLGKFTTALPSRPNNGHSTPVVHEIDGQYHLFAGSLHGQLYHYSNIDNNLTGAFQLQNDMLVPFKGSRIYPTMAQLYGSDHFSLVVGNLRGGVSLFTQEILAADFSASAQEVCVGDTVFFTDQSSGVPSGWSWDFQGASTNSSSAQHPFVVYTEPGSHNVSLTVSYPDEMSTTTKEAYILVRSLPTVSITETNPLICASKCDGAIAAAASGNAPFVYSWSNGSTVAAINGLCMGTHTVTVTDANGCQQKLVYELEAPEVVVSYDLALTPANCGEYDGCAVIDNVSGGTLSPLEVIWPDNVAGNSYCDLYAGVYSFQIKDANDCVFDQVFEIINPGAPIINVNVVDVTCEGKCDGYIYTTIDGNAPPYQYNWSGGLSNQPNHMNLCEISLNLLVVDADLCQSSPKNIEVGYQYKQPVAGFTATPNVIDLYFSDEVIFNNESENATSYEWNFGDGATSTLENPVHQFTESGQFNVVLKAYAGDGLCEDEITQVIQVLNTTSVVADKKSNFTLFPNPTSDKVKIQFPQEGTALVRLFSYDGALLIEKLVVNNGELDLSQYATGVYILKIQTELGTNDQFKLVKQ